MTRVAVVTGANKGIGLAIVRALCKEFDGIVYLTARNVQRGEEAVKVLEKEGLSPKFHPLDIDTKSSIDDMTKYLKQNYNGVDTLVNNAGIKYFKPEEGLSIAEQAKGICQTNYHNTLTNCISFFPILKPHSRTVNMAGMVFPMAMKQMSQEKQNLFKQCHSIQDLNSIMKTYLAAVEKGVAKEEGWCEDAYWMSKVAVAVMTPIQQKWLDKERSNQDIIVNSVCPGYCSTDMTKHQGPLTPDQGAKNPVYLATLPPNSTTPQGEFIMRKRVVPWRK